MLEIGQLKSEKPSIVKCLSRLKEKDAIDAFIQPIMLIKLSCCFRNILYQEVLYMLSAYPACFFKEENGYSVIFPGLNHLATCGETLDEALAMAINCLAGYLYLLRKDGEIAPDPLPMNEVNLSDIAKELEIESTES